MYDFHCHTTMSDGDLLPLEIIRRFSVLGYTEIAISDHADFSNIDTLLKSVTPIKKSAELYGVHLYTSVELTHIPPNQIDELAKYAKKHGAEIVVVHGETVVEPVAPGTNTAAVSSQYVDILAHPGLITEEDAKIAAQNDVCLEITQRAGHNRSNGHVLLVGRHAGAKFVIGSDAHSTGDLMDKRMRYLVARGAGMTEEESNIALSHTYNSLFNN
ncbi:MAG TPA: histidinol phosphate phosphatase domain-containing protein [Methanocorpusculum sp.]|nr:histidinol phosphate phosphatase domain-containing protein [Methanocorpusculum sp.]